MSASLCHDVRPAGGLLRAASRCNKEMIRQSLAYVNGLDMLDLFIIKSGDHYPCGETMWHIGPGSTSR